MPTVHNARVQLVATALNNLALAFIVAGFVAPAVGGHLQSDGRALTGLAWAVTGLVLPGAARFALGRLRQ